MASSVQKKVERLFELMGRLAAGEELYPQNVRVQQELDVDERTLRRYLEDIHDMYGHIVTTEKKKVDRDGRRVTVYRVADKSRDVSEVLRFFLESSDDLTWLLQLVYENDPTLLRDFSKETKEKLGAILKEDEGIFQYVGSPFENLEDPRLKETFVKLRLAVKNHEYRTIDYRYRDEETIGTPNASSSCI
jgi:predicted DNA-binding transcriptional regulator YafY